MASVKHSIPKEVEALRHTEDRRKVIPNAEHQPILSKEQETPVPVTYGRRNRDLDPQLVWRGKDEQDWSDLVVQAPPLYIQEKVHPKVLIDDLVRQSKVDQQQIEQLDLFADFNGIPAEADKTEFYQHDQNWTNRMILGDSLQVMASLAEREGLRGKVQCIYFDPPYGIKFNSNFQWSTTSRDVKDGNRDHITREPEQVKAFRDTWRDGIHSYLTYLRDRLTVARDLLTDSGSIFVQIGDENVHRVRAVMDEVFGDENCIATITFKKTGGQSSAQIAAVSDYLLFFAKDIRLCKFRPLFSQKSPGDEGATNYSWIEDANGVRRPLTAFERFNDSPIPTGSKIMQPYPMFSDGPSTRDIPFEWRGMRYSPSSNAHWKTHAVGLKRVERCDRFVAQGKTLRFVNYLADYSVTPIINLWTDTQISGFGSDRIYVVQTLPKVIERCILMATDPGDLVLDPTCVRKGTLVLTPLNPPEYGGKAVAPSLYSGRAGEGSVLTPLNPPEYGGKGIAPAPGCPLGAGRVGEGAEMIAVPIEQLQPGDWVYAHDGQCHRVVRTLKRIYSGEMIGLRHEGSEEVLWVTNDHLVLSQRRVTALSQNGGWSEIPKAHFGRARTLRNEMTLPERILWQRLRGEQVGVKFRRQHPIGPYIADFYTRDVGLVVEVDGGTHSATPEAIAYDHERDQYMQARGLRVLRFTASDVTRSPWAVADAIAQACRERVLTDDANKQWRFAGDLQAGDLVFSGIERTPQRIVAIEHQTTVEEVYDLEVEDAHSFLTTVCAIHNCGSGTTATVAEQWGRRWITIDTSRVALALARARIMGARYPYYLLADSREGQIKEAEVTRTPPASQPTRGNLRHGFVYERVPHITLKSIANNAEIDVIWERWQATLEPLRAALNVALFDPSPALPAPSGHPREGAIPSPALPAPSGHPGAGASHPPQAGGKGGWQEWEIPREAESGWSAAVKQIHRDWWAARIARQQAIDASIAAKAEFETLYDKPYTDNKKVRVAGPFTVESLSPHRMLGVDENDELIDTLKERGPGYSVKQSFPEMILENLKTAGVQQAHKADKIDFIALTPWPGELVCAEGRYLEGDTEKRAAIFIGPEFGTVQRADLVQAAREAGDAAFDLLIACAFNYEAHTTEFSKLGRLTVLKARMNADLHMAEDLKNTGKGNLFVIFGEPDITLLPVAAGQLCVKINGVDVFHPNTGEVRSDGAEGIACWFIDTDYNEESFFVRHAYFLGANDPYSALKTTLKAEINEEAWATLNSDISRPFAKPKSGRIAVKVINHLGDEVMKVFRV